jgi:hypothetical protein
MKKVSIGTCFILFILIMYATISCQSKKDDYRELEGLTDYTLVVDNSSASPYYISHNPVTNREYITYLCWLYDVYQDYPEVFYRAIPGTEADNSAGLINNESGQVNNFSSTVLGGKKINIDYVFNPKFIDYPVVGLTRDQAMNFCNWLSDRYNEAILITKNYLSFDPEQSNENNFTTEAYIFGQYEGIVNNPFIDSLTKEERKVQWNDGLLYPTFRLPARSELESVNKIILKEFIPYKPAKFLNLWTNYYIVVQKDTLILKLFYNDEEEIKIGAPANAETAKYMSGTEEHTMDEVISSPLTNILDIYKELGQKLIDQADSGTFILAGKDRLGRMPFVLLGEDTKSTPVYVERSTQYIRSEGQPVKNGNYFIFRAAMNAVR